MKSNTLSIVSQMIMVVVSLFGTGLFAASSMADPAIVSTVIKTKNGDLLGFRTPYEGQELQRIKGISDVVMLTNGAGKSWTTKKADGDDVVHIPMELLAVGSNGAAYAIMSICVTRVYAGDWPSKCSYEAKSIPEFGKDVISVNGNGDAAVVVKRDGSFVFWGEDLRLKSVSPATRIGGVPAFSGRLPAPLVSAATNGTGFIGLDVEGRVWLFGLNNESLLPKRFLPKDLTISGDYYFKLIQGVPKMKSVSAGSMYAMLSVDGVVYEFGSLLYTEKPFMIDEPQPVLGLPAVKKVLSYYNCLLFLSVYGDLWYKYGSPNVFYTTNASYVEGRIFGELGRQADFSVIPTKIISGLNISDFDLSLDTGQGEGIYYIITESGLLLTTGIVKPSNEKQNCVSKTAIDHINEVNLDNCEFSAR